MLKSYGTCKLCESHNFLNFAGLCKRCNRTEAGSEIRGGVVEKQMKTLEAQKEMEKQKTDEPEEKQALEEKNDETDDKEKEEEKDSK